MKLICRLEFNKKPSSEALVRAVDDLTQNADVAIILQRPDAVQTTAEMADIFKNSGDLYLLMDGEKNNPMGALSSLTRSLNATSQAYKILG